MQPHANSKAIVYLKNNEELAKIEAYARDYNIEITEVKQETGEGRILNDVLTGIRSQKHPHLLVWDLFSLSASPVHLDSIFALFQKSSSHLTIVKDQLSTINNRELVFDVGRMMIRYAVGSRIVKIKAGQERAKEEGRHLGRPGISDKDLAEAKDLRDKGLSYRQIGRLLKMDESTVRKNLKKLS